MTKKLFQPLDNKDIDRHKTALAEYAVKEIFIKKAEALLEKE